MFNMVLFCLTRQSPDCRGEVISRCSGQLIEQYSNNLLDSIEACGGRIWLDLTSRMTILGKYTQNQFTTSYSLRIWNLTLEVVNGSTTIEHPYQGACKVGCPVVFVLQWIIADDSSVTMFICQDAGGIVPVWAILLSRRCRSPGTFRCSLFIKPARIADRSPLESTISDFTLALKTLGILGTQS